MSTFTGHAQFEEVMASLFSRIVATPTLAEPLGRTELVVRFRYPDLDSVLTFDFKHKAASPTFATLVD